MQMVFAIRVSWLLLKNETVANLENKQNTRHGFQGIYVQEIYSRREYIQEICSRNMFKEYVLEKCSSNMLSNMFKEYDQGICSRNMS